VNHIIVIRPTQDEILAPAENLKSDPPQIIGFKRPRNTGAKDDQNLCPEELTMFKPELVRLFVPDAVRKSHDQKSRCAFRIDRGESVNHSESRRELWADPRHNPTCLSVIPG